MRSNAFLLAVILGLVTSHACPDHAVEAKDITAGPEDITSGRVRLPDPGSFGAKSRTALLRCAELTPALRRFVPGPGKAMAALLAPDVEDWSLSAIIDDGGDAIDAPLHSAEELVPGSLARVVTCPEGASQMRLFLEPPEPGTPGWILIADGREDLELFTHFGSHGAILGGRVTVHARVDGGDLLAGEVRMTAPDGEVHVVNLGAGNPSTASFTPALVGDWTVRTIVRARDRAGRERLRTNQQILRVVDPELTLSDGVQVSQSDDGRIELSVPVILLPQEEVAPTRRVAMGCEVWGLDADGTSVPVCWVARMHQLPVEGGPSSCSLRFDARWFALAGVDPMTMELRELRVHDSAGFVLLDHDPDPAVLMPDSIREVPAPTGVPEPGMHAGRSGRMVTGHAPPSTARLSPGGHVLLLSHGYCTDRFPWRTGDFSGDIELYEDYDQNLTHDEFALRFEAYGRNFKSMGIAGHSQGGNAAAHLFTFYWSALDWPTGDRRIQGVGVPWLGTPLAGNAAVLGEVFGIGCGVNYDLTYEGSAAWLSFIPGWVREDVWYWTTSFTDGWFYDYCQIVTDVLLSDPDDGTVERYAGQLEGANNGGHKTGWCHTRLMRDPPQCRDADRNVELSAEAAR